jgi:hypothetical protein
MQEEEEKEEGERKNILKENILIFRKKTFLKIH